MAYRHHKSEAPQASAKPQRKKLLKEWFEESFETKVNHNKLLQGWSQIYPMFTSLFRDVGTNAKKKVPKTQKVFTRIPTNMSKAW
jgi:hypothetical protein